MKYFNEKLRIIPISSYFFPKLKKKKRKNKTRNALTKVSRHGGLPSCFPLGDKKIFGIKWRRRIKNTLEAEKIREKLIFQTVEEST